jgi:hypothetical protein
MAAGDARIGRARIVVSGRAAPLNDQARGADAFDPGKKLRGAGRSRQHVERAGLREPLGRERFALIRDEDGRRVDAARALEFERFETALSRQIDHDAEQAVTRRVAEECICRRGA